MIISHTYKYVYLQPVGMDSHVGYVALRNKGLVDKSDICSALYIDDIKLLPSQNFKELTLSEYSKKFGFTSFERRPSEQIMTIINASLTLDELVKLGYLTHKQINEYLIFSFLREPVDRFTAIFTESQVRRPIPQDMLEDMFVGSLEDKFTHLLWQDQIPYHTYKGKVVSLPLIYDKFFYSIEKMIINLASSLHQEDKLKYTYSLNYNTDPTVLELVKKYRERIEKKYQKDIKLWNKLRDSM